MINSYKYQSHTETAPQYAVTLHVLKMSLKAPRKPNSGQRTVNRNTSKPSFRFRRNAGSCTKLQSHGKTGNCDGTLHLGRCERRFGTDYQLSLIYRNSATGLKSSRNDIYVRVIPKLDICVALNGAYAAVKALGLHR